METQCEEKRPIAFLRELPRAPFGNLEILGLAVSDVRRADFKRAHLDVARTRRLLECVCAVRVALLFLFCGAARLVVLETEVPELYEIVVPLYPLRIFEPASEVINFSSARRVVSLRAKVAVEALPLVDVVTPRHVPVRIDADRCRALARHECCARGIAKRRRAIRMGEIDAARR